MTRQNDKKPLKPKADDQSHKPATHIEETARMASSVETAKDPGRFGTPRIKSRSGSSLVL